MRRIYDWKMELYWRLPVFVQESMLSAYAAYLDRRYYGRAHDEWLEKFSERINWSRAETEQWQNERLQFLINLAATRVPYFREHWRDLDWRRVRSSADLHMLP